MADLENFTTPGHVENLVMDDGLRAINFYRKLYGLNEVELDNELSENAQYGALLSLVTGDLSNPIKPNNMNDEFYHKAMLAFDKNCVRISENLTEAPIVDAVHYLFSCNYYFREKLLDESITKIGFGVCSNSDGKTAALIKFEDREEYFNSYNFTPYLCEGLYPISLVQVNPELTVTLGKSLFSGDRGNLNITIVNERTNEEIVLDSENDFEIIDDGNKTIVIKNIAFKFEKDTKFKVKVGNICDENGMVVNLEYSTKLFELKADPKPIDPDDPDTPDDPSDPDNPDNPDNPDTPENPDDNNNSSQGSGASNNPVDVTENIKENDEE